MNQKQKKEAVELAESLYEVGRSFWLSDYDVGKSTYEKEFPDEKQALDRLVELINGGKA